MHIQYYLKSKTKQFGACDVMCVIKSSPHKLTWIRDSRKLSLYLYKILLKLQTSSGSFSRMTRLRMHEMSLNGESWYDIFFLPLFFPTRHVLVSRTCARARDESSKGRGTWTRKTGGKSNPSHREELLVLCVMLLAHYAWFRKPSNVIKRQRA